MDHDIHFRAGVGIDGRDTYTPRTLIYDLKGGFGSLRKLNALYDDTTAQHVQDAALWRSTPVAQRQSTISPAVYQQDLDLGLPTNQIRKEDVKFWSDYNRVFYHPRSAIQLSEYSVNSSIAPFESWTAGEELWVDVDREADLLDRDVRLFAEEADQMHGFQIFTGSDDAWGGWCSKYVDALRDEFGKKSIWTWGLEDTRRTERNKMVLRAANAAKTLQSLNGLVNSYVRLRDGGVSLPEYIQIDTGNEWESSALIATAIESITLPTRLRDGPGLRQARYAEIEHVLNTNGRQNVFDLGMSAEEHNEMRHNGARSDPRAPQGISRPYEEETVTYDLNFTPGVLSLLPPGTAPAKISKHVFAQTQLSRRSMTAAGLQLANRTPDREEMLRRRYHDETIVDRFVAPLPFPKLDSMPPTLFSFPHGKEDTSARRLQVSCGLSSSASMKNTVLELRDIVVRHYRAIAVDEREEMYNDLTEMGAQYTSGWESDDSEDDN